MLYYRKYSIEKKDFGDILDNARGSLKRLFRDLEDQIILVDNEKYFVEYCPDNSEDKINIYGEDLEIIPQEIYDIITLFLIR